MGKVAISFILLSALGAALWLFVFDDSATTDSAATAENERVAVGHPMPEESLRSRLQQNAEEEPVAPTVKAQVEGNSAPIVTRAKHGEGASTTTQSQDAKARTAALAKAAKDKQKAAPPKAKAAANIDSKSDPNLPPKQGVKDRRASLSRDDRVVLTLKGRVTGASFNRLRGYVYDTAAREATFTVLLFVDGEEAAEFPAEAREVHKTLGVVWRFDYKNPEALADRKGHQVRFYATREGEIGRTELASSPRNLAENNYPQGRLEACSAKSGINGYAFDWDDTKLASEVTLLLDGQIIGSGVANRKNPTYKKRRLTPTDKNAFSFPWSIPDDGASHLVQAFVKDAVSEELVELEGSPRSVIGSHDAVNRPPEGRLSVVNRAVIAGWAWDPDADQASIDVELWIDGAKFNVVTANTPQQTLVSAKITKDPNHGFAIQTPIELLDGEAHTVRVFAIDPRTSVLVEIEGSRRLYRMSDNEAPMGGFWRADEKMLRGWAVDPDLGAAPCDISIYIDGNLWKTTKADRAETFIQQDGYAPNKEHGFLIVPPDAVKDGHEHEVKIYAHNSPDGPPRLLGTRTIGVASVFPGFWTSDRELDSRAPQGLYITSVSPWYDAYHQDVLKGDVFLTLNGMAFTETSKFRDELNAKYKKNDKVKITLWRDGEILSKEVKLGEIIGA